MCRMAAFSFKKDIDTYFIFKDLQKMAQYGMNAPHKDGWGVHLICTNSDVFHYKSIRSIYNDELPHFQACSGIMHARLASEGLDATPLQLHPFLDNDGDAFCHNGTVYGTPKTAPFKSDSLDLFNSIRKFSTTEQLIENINSFTEKYNYTSLNFFLVKKNIIYILNRYKEQDPRKQLYYKLWIKKNNEGVIIRSESLSDGDYTSLENGDLLEIKNGSYKKYNIIRK